MSLSPPYREGGMAQNRKGTESSAPVLQVIQSEDSSPD